MLTLLLPLLMQVGPAPTSSPISAVPPELRDRPQRNLATADRAPSLPAIEVCLATARTDPAKALSLADEWVARTEGLQRAAGRHCQGVAAGNAGDWSGAAEAFLAARADGAEPRFRARMAALAGSALLTAGNPAEALSTLDAAIGEAAGDAELTGAIAMDRASALVALGRTGEAAAALESARAAVPGDAHAWLLSATLARRSGDLPTAQTQIEEAARIDPRDPAIGLEAGVIAALGGRSEAARKSFQSVVAAAPDGPQAAAAQAYLAQLSGE